MAAVRFLLAPDGSRGDVQPLLVLGERLLEAGHVVTMCGPPGFAAAARAGGIEFHPLPFDLEAWSAQRADLMTRGGRHGLRMLHEMFSNMMDSQFSALAPLAPGVDCIVGGGPQMAGAALAQAHGARFVEVLYVPTSVPSLDHLPFMLPPLRLPRWGRWLAWRALGAYYQHRYGARLERHRRALRLPPLRNIYTDVVGDDALLACDAEIGPAPATAAIRIRQVGAFHRSGVAALAPHIADFIATGPPPVYVGFGSMRDEDPATTTRMVVQAAAAAGQRLIIHAGWAGLGRAVPANVLVVDDVPHAALFPRMAGVVHHGGAGTTAAAARAGVPQLLVPHLADQPYFAGRIATIGLGPPAIPRAQLTAARLARGLRALTGDPAMTARARALGVRLRARDGTGEAVRLLTEPSDQRAAEPAARQAGNTRSTKRLRNTPAGSQARRSRSNPS